MTPDFIEVAIYTLPVLAWLALVVVIFVKEFWK